MFGGSGWNFISRAADQVKQMVSNAPPKIGNYLGDLSNDPGRVLVGIGTLGGSEVLRAAGGEIQAKMEEEAKRNQPKFELPGGPSLPAADDGKSLKDEKRPRGRASTILTGGRGVGGSATTARRTLLGV